MTTSLYICTLLSFGANAQNESILDEFSLQPSKNAFGEPTNNALSPSMVKFGDWFYLDALNKPFYKRKYVDGKIAGESILLKGEYLIVSNDKTGNLSDMESKASDMLASIDMKTDYRKGCAFVINPSDRSFVAAMPYGKWDASDLEKINTLLINNTPNNVLDHVAIIWK